MKSPADVVTNYSSLFALCLLAISLLTGCAESLTLAGNGASMLVATALLWSTVHIGRPGDEERG